MSTFLTTTSSTRPSNPSAGDTYFETDTKNVIIWDGTDWRGYLWDTVLGWTGSNSYAVDFDGTNDYMAIADADIFSLGNGSGTDNAFSISAWFNADSIGTFVIAAKDKTGAREWEFRTISSQLHFYAFGTGGGYIGRNSSTTLSTGQWYHAVVTYDASKANSGIKLYINGSQVDNGNYSGGTYTAAANHTNQVWVGRSEISGIADGKIDEFAIFNSELTSAQVTNIYKGEASGGSGGTNGKPGDLASFSPAGWWRMGDNENRSEPTVFDQGSGGNNGTLTNSPSFYDLSTAPDSIYVA